MVSLLGAGAVQVMLLGQLESTAPFALYFLAVAISAWYGGLVPGLLATGVGMGVFLGILLLRSSPAQPLAAHDWIWLGVVLLTSLTVTLICEQLHQARRWVHGVLESITDGFCTLDRQWRITMVNPQAEALFQRKQEELLGQVFWEVFPQVRGTEVERALRQAFDEHTPTHLEVEGVIRPEGWLMLRVYPRPEGLAVFLLDNSEQKRAEATVRLSEARLNQAQRAGKVGSWERDLATTGELTWSEQTYRMFDEEPGKFVPTMEATVAKVHPEDRERMNRTFHEALAGPGHYRNEYRVLRADGSVRVYQSQGEVERDEQGRAMRVIGTIMDVTEQRAGQQRLVDSEGRLRVLYETMLQGVVHRDGEGRLLSTNPAAERIQGSKLPEVLDVAKESPEHPTLRADGRPLPRGEHPALVALRTGREVRDVVLGIFNLREGAYRWINLTAVPLTEPGAARPSQVYTIFNDITEQRAREEQLRASEEKYRQIVDTALEGIWVLDGEGRTTFANAAMARMLGYSVEEMMGRPLFDFMDETWRRNAEQKLEQRRAGLSEQHDFCFRRKDGRELWGFINTSLMFDAQGRMTGVLGMITDITDRKRDEAELRAKTVEAECRAAEAAEANRAKDRFLAVLSHELRTPLTPVAMAVGALETEETLPEGVRSELAMVRRNIDLEVRIIDDLLDISRVTSGKMRLRPELVHVQEIVRRAAEICGDEMRERKQELVCDFGAGRDLVEGDGGRLQQVFWNLIRNAVKFSAEGGRIVLRCENPAPGRVWVRVRDEGIGIPAERLEAIFNAFEQAETARKFGGLGLGLAISRAIVELHKGRIWAESAGPGQGATFTVELTLTEEEPRTAPAKRPTAADAGGRAPQRLLLVEDHTDTARTLARLLRSCGYAVEVAESMGAATEKLRTMAFDMLLSDLGLPDGSGYDLMRQVREQYGIPGICMSGYGMAEDVRKSLEAGFLAHLTKPIDLEQLMQAICGAKEAARGSSVQESGR